MRTNERLLALAVALRNVVLGSNLVAAGLWRDPGRLLGYVNEVLFLYRSYTGSHGLPQKNVFEILPGASEARIELGHLRPWASSKDVWFKPVPSYTVDLVSLCLICQIVRPRVVFEIGTLRGYTTLHLAMNTPPEATIHSLDLPPSDSWTPALRTTVIDRRHIAAHDRRDGHCFDGTPLAAKIHCLYGDSATFDFEPFRERVDFFFIDGAHSYEYVRSDTMNALRCCRPGSVVAWHDFGRAGVNGVSRWLLELARTRQVYCVPGGSLAFMRVDGP